MGDGPARRPGLRRRSGGIGGAVVVRVGILRAATLYGPRSATPRGQGTAVLLLFLPDPGSGRSGSGSLAARERRVHGGRRRCGFSEYAGRVGTRDGDATGRADTVSDQLLVVQR